MNLVEKLKQQTKILKESYIQSTITWSRKEYSSLKAFVNDYHANYDVSKEKKYYSLQACVVNMNGTVDEYIAIQVKKANKHYNISIQKLAERIIKKGLQLDKLQLSTAVLDPNISTTITDGKKTICAYTIIAWGMIQRPHYRYLIKTIKK